MPNTGNSPFFLHDMKHKVLPVRCQSLSTNVPGTLGTTCLLERSATGTRRLWKLVLGYTITRWRTVSGSTSVEDLTNRPHGIMTPNEVVEWSITTYILNLIGWIVKHRYNVPVIPVTFGTKHGRW